jgi:hypothetical protein
MRGSNPSAGQTFILKTSLATFAMRGGGVVPWTLRFPDLAPQAANDIPRTKIVVPFSSPSTIN